MKNERVCEIGPFTIWRIPDGEFGEFEIYDATSRRAAMGSPDRAKAWAINALWRDLEGFTPPNCPECGRPADLDQDGYWCSQCSEMDNPNPAVDNIPNGAEFDDLLAAWQEAAGIVPLARPTGRKESRHETAPHNRR